METKVILGIDPDNKESGVALLGVPSKDFKVMKMKFAELIDYLWDAKGIFRNLEVIIEGGWLNRSNWHIMARHMSPRMAAAVGRSTGMNHQTGILISEYCEHLGLDYKVVKPLKKCWKGTDGKITQEEMKSFIPNLPRMNQDQRDALLIAWVYAGLPIKVKMERKK